MVELGKIERVNVRSVWQNEERNFTPWLKDHIELLSELIGEDIEDIKHEENVGNYSADLIGKIVGSDDYIVIENQFGFTNHDHLGKLLTYSSGKRAKIGVWIAEEFNEEHLAALDYLNENMKSEGPSFFGIKIELKKIGNSLPAPELVVLVKPNTFQRNLSREVLSEGDRKRHALRVEFFSRISDAYKILNPSWNKVKAQPNHWLSFGAGRSGFAYSWSFRARNGWRFAIELYIDQQDQEENKQALKELEQERTQIEQELEFSLDFQELPERRACRIEFSKQTSGPITKLSEDEMKELIKWGSENMTTFSKVMTQYIKKLE
jgi:hypothetical protein